MRVVEFFASILWISISLPAFGQATSHHLQLSLKAKQPLSQAANGVDGELELWQDSRLTPKLSQSMWGTGGIDIDDDPVETIFKKEPPHDAELRLVNHDGKVLQREPLERSLAHLKATYLYGDKRISYEVTVDYSAGFGSYSGPITTFVEVHDAHLSWVEATDTDGKSERLTLMQSLKTAWKQVPRANGKAAQFLEASCRPKDFGSSEPTFQITYKHYFFDGKQWKSLVRTQDGFTEFDNGFPQRSLFP